MSCDSLSSPGVQLPTGTEWPCPHPWRHQPGDQDPRCCPLWEAEARWHPEWVLLGKEFTVSQHHQWRDRPHHYLPLQGVWQVGTREPGIEPRVTVNDCPEGAVSPTRGEKYRLSGLPLIPAMRSTGRPSHYLCSCLCPQQTSLINYHIL